MSVSSSPLGSGTPAPAPGSYNFFGGSNPTPAAPSTAAPGNPLISVDQGTLSQYYMNEIGAYSVNTSGIPGMTATTIGAALQDIYNMSPSDLEQLQQLLFSAGYYQNADGSPISNMASISFGTPDSQTWMALGRALSTSATSGQSLMQNLVNRGSAGVGVKQISGALNPVTGGGGTYQVNLTNPQDVYQTAVQVFQGALGRMPTQDELSRLTSSLQSQETSYQQGINTQTEQMSQAAYQAKLNSRAALTTPQTGAGPVPNTPFKTPADFATALISYMFGPDKVTASNVALISAWVAAAGGIGTTNNPLGIHSTAAGSTQTPGGVQAYMSPAEGLQAAANLLSTPQYQGLYAALLSGDGSSSATDPTVAAELSQWSGGKVKSLKITKAVQTAAQNAAQAFTAQPQPTTTTAGAGQPITDPLSLALGGGITSLPGQSLSYQQPQSANAAQSGAQAFNPNASTLPPGQTAPSQSFASPGDFYLPPSTLTSVQPPSPSAAAYTAATTGANKIPFMGNEFLNAYQSILSMIKAGGPTG